MLLAPIIGARSGFVAVDARRWGRGAPAPRRTGGCGDEGGVRRLPGLQRLRVGTAVTAFRLTAGQTDPSHSP